MVENLKVILKSLREYKKPSLMAPFTVGLEVLFECFLPLIMASLINEMSSTSSTLDPIIGYGIILTVLALLSLAAGAVAAMYSSTAACGLSKNLRNDLFNKIQDFGFGDIDKFSSSSLVTRMTTDITNIQMGYQMTIRGAVRTPLMLIFSVVMIYSINAKLSIIFLVMVPLLGYFLIKLASVVFPIFKKIFKKYDAVNNSVQENIAGIRVVKSFNREEHEKDKFGNAAVAVQKDFTHVEKILALNSPVMMLCIYAAITLVSYFGAKMIISSGGSTLSTGELSAIITYGTQLLSSMMMLSFMFVMISMASEPLNRVAEVLTHESTLVSPENGIKEVKDGSISFENVKFKYNENSKNYVLDDINLEIKSGQTIGIIGGTGSSKTSLINLISRLYDVTDGSVKVGGIDVREYDLVSLRNQVSVVLQKNVLFSGTINENLRWGDENASDEEVIRVSKLAQADEFVASFPDGYESHIERGGSNVSGGQKQRLCIARALLKKPKIIILDDSTSAVDTKTDALIRNAFKKEIPDTTKIIIAQRTSSVEDADKILVLDHGKIAEQGTSNELLALNGIYREVYDSQNKSKEVD